REVQRFLAKAYTDFSTIKDKEHYLTIAVKAHRDAISKSHNSSNANDNYIRMNELALTLMKLAEVKDKEANLLEAKTYLKESADNISIEENAEYLAQTQSNLSCVYGELSEITDKEENLEKALFYTKESLKIYTSKDFPYYHARAVANLGTLMIHWVQFSQNGSKAKETSEAIDMILKAVDFFTLKDYPLNYANTMIALGEAYEIAAIGKDKSLNLQNAIGSYQNALKVFTPVKYPDAHKKCSDSISRLEILMEKTKK
ncbi:MAG: hypothetical protein Q8K02_05025, partial [Flavobacterium sp.]|nr:hypothetical protein [Flavobacterium sp.]